MSLSKLMVYRNLLVTFELLLCNIEARAFDPIQMRKFLLCWPIKVKDFSMKGTPLRKICQFHGSYFSGVFKITFVEILYMKMSNTSLCIEICLSLGLYSNLKTSIQSNWVSYGIGIASFKLFKCFNSKSTLQRWVTYFFFQIFKTIHISRHLFLRYTKKKQT